MLALDGPGHSHISGEHANNGGELSYQKYIMNLLT